MDSTETAYGISACPNRVQVLFNGYLIGDSANARILREPGQPDVYYLPKDDVEMTFFVQTDETDETERRTAETPERNGAAYWRVMRNGLFVQRAAWSYEGSIHEDLHGMLGFDPKAFEFHIVHHDSERMWRNEEDRIGEYIRHTDSGSGRSQETHWPANVSQPDGETGEFDEDDPRAL
jgi:uncharacterized protein (DUF427 family)